MTQIKDQSQNSTLWHTKKVHGQVTKIHGQVPQITTEYTAGSRKLIPGPRLGSTSRNLDSKNVKKNRKMRPISQIIITLHYEKIGSSTVNTAASTKPTTLLNQRRISRWCAKTLNSIRPVLKTRKSHTVEHRVSTILSQRYREARE